jgi:hypothetical protein
MTRLGVQALLLIVSALLIAGCQGPAGEPGPPGTCEGPTAEAVASALMELPEFKALMAQPTAATPSEAGSVTPEAFMACVANLRAPSKVNVMAKRAIHRIHQCARPPKPTE